MVEDTWTATRRYLTATRLVISMGHYLYSTFFLCDDYHFAVDWQGQPTDQRQLALLYVNLRDVPRTDQHL